MSWLRSSLNKEGYVTHKNLLSSAVNPIGTFHSDRGSITSIYSIDSDDSRILNTNDQHSARIFTQEMKKQKKSSKTYSYYSDKHKNEDWYEPSNSSESVSKSLSTLMDATPLDSHEHSRCKETLTYDTLQAAETDLNENDQYFHLFNQVLIHTKPNKQDRQQLRKLFEEECKDNIIDMNLMNKFFTEYRASDAVSWYMHKSFISQMLNQALYQQNVDVLILYRGFIQDLFKQLCKHQCRKRIQVYRGQMMSKMQLNEWNKAYGDFISMNLFLSATTDRGIVLKQLKDWVISMRKDEYVPVLFEIDADPHVYRNASERSKPFAQLSEIIPNKKASEVLFMIGSIFRLDQIFHDRFASVDVKISIIRITWCSEYDDRLNELYNHMNKFGSQGADLISFGCLNYKLGKFDLAEKFFHDLLDELPLNHHYISSLYHNLGMCTNASCKYDTSLEWYTKSLQSLLRTEPVNHIRVAVTHNSMGNVYRNKGDHNEALVFYNRAISRCKRLGPEYHSYLASFYNNVGVVYYDLKMYRKALEFYEKSIAIKRKHLLSDHVYLCASYDNIGVTYRCLGEYDLALESFNQSLSIRLKSFPAQHIDIAMSYENLALVYKDKNEFEKASMLFQEALRIYSQSLPFDHPNILKIKSNLEHI